MNDLIMNPVTPVAIVAIAFLLLATVLKR